MKPYLLRLIVLFVLLTSCKKAAQFIDPIPEHETFTISSKQVGELRTINVWTPPEYNTNADSLPVLYMPDGGINEDFPHIANTLAELIQSKKIDPIILVGIENTERRRDLTGETSVEEDKKIAPIVGGSEKFRSFIENELFVEINKRYRTTTKRGIIGESLAGLFVTEIFFLNPEMFDFYIAFDPSLWWNNKYLVKTAEAHLRKFPNTQKSFWFAGSGAEDIFEIVGKLSNILEVKNIGSLRWKYAPEPNEKHNTIFRATKEKAIIWTLENKSN